MITIHLKEKCAIIGKCKKTARVTRLALVGNMIISLLMNIDDYYNEPIGRSFGNCDIYNTTITWLRKHEHMARYFPMFLVFGAKFQYFDNGE